MVRIESPRDPFHTLAALCLVLWSVAHTVIAADDIDYRQFCERRLGRDTTGLVLRDIGDDQWELIAVASGPMVERNGVDASQSFREAVLIADALAHQMIAKFISGVQLKTSDESLTDSQVIIDSAQSEKTRERFVQQIKEHQQQDVFAFLRGTRRAAEWQKEGGADAFAVITLNQADVQKGMDISRSILTPDLGGDRFEVVQTSGTDQRPQRVRVVGMAAVGTRSVPEARRMAIYDGLHLAVQRVAGLTLSSRTSLEDLRRLESQLSSITAGMVKSFLILEENRSSDGYSVLLEVEVQRNLGGNIELLRDLLGNITVAIAGQKGGPFDRNYSLDQCRQALEQRRIPYINLGINPLGYKGNEPLTTPADAMCRACERGGVVMIWCDTAEWLQAYCVSTREMIGTRLAATYKDQNGSTSYGWRTWQPWNDWFDTIVNHWYDEAFNGTYIRIEINGGQTSGGRSNVDAHVAREVAGRVEDVLRGFPKCKGVRRIGINAEFGRVFLNVRWTGGVDEIVREVFERSEDKVTGGDTRVADVEFAGNTIFVVFWKTP